MLLIDFFKQLFYRLDQRQFRTYIALYIGTVLALMIGMFVWYGITMNGLQHKVQQLNKVRKQVQQVLTDFTLVEKQREKVDLLLRQDKNFYLQKYAQDLLSSVHLSSNISDKPTSIRLDNGYTEELLSFTLSNIDTKQLCLLLQELEKEERVSVKSIEISKNNSKAINVTMSIATLIPKSE